MAYSAFIVDDESLARANLVAALSAMQDWKVIAEYERADGVMDNARALKPDVIFLDINMPGQDGVSLAGELLALQPAPLIIFVTAYDDRAVQAFEINALDYLLKPFDDDRLHAALERAAESMNLRDQYDARIRSVEEIRRQDRPLQRIIVRSVRKLQIVEVNEIICACSAGNYVELNLEGQTVLHRTPISTLVKLLDSGTFMRVHRTALINLSRVRELKTDSGGKMHALLDGEYSVPVSDNYRDALVRRITV